MESRMMLKGAQILWECLVREGVEVFITSQARLATQGFEAPLGRGRDIKSIKKLRQRHIAVRASDDPLIALRKGSGAHLEHLWSSGCALAQIATYSQLSSPPSPRIIGTKLGKLVAMNEVSSTPTGLSLASPMTRNAMAMR